MTKLEKVLQFAKIGLGIIALFFLARIAVPKMKFGAVQNVPNYVSTEFAQTNGSTSTGTVIAAYPGTLHSIVFTTPVATSIVSVYDSNTNVIVPLTTATGTITFGSTSTATSTATGTFIAIINGFSITTVSVPVASTTAQVATAMTTAINASSTVLSGLTATSTNNIVTITAPIVGPLGNFTLGLTGPQNGINPTSIVTNATGTTLLAKYTIPASPQPFTSIFDGVFTKGLVINQTAATSTITLNYQQQ